VATVASTEDRRRVEEMQRRFENLVALDCQLWGEDKRAYGVVPDELRDVVALSQHALNDLSQDLYRYSKWLLAIWTDGVDVGSTGSPLPPASVGALAPETPARREGLPRVRCGRALGAGRA
jgi:hypothetical protein